MCTPSTSCCAFLHFSVQFGIDQSDKVPFKFRVFRNERVDRTESSKSRAPVPPASGASEIAPGAPSAVAGEPSALHLPLPPPLPGSSSSCPFTGFQPQYARGFTLLSYYKVLYCKIKFFLYFLFSVFFVIFV